MPFAARGGISFQRVTPAPTVPAWQTMTPAEISSEVSTWELTGSQTYGGHILVDTDNLHGSMILGANDRIYLAPQSPTANTLVEYDIDANVVTKINTGFTFSGAAVFLSGALGSDSKLYWAPYNYDKVLIYDPAANVFTEQTWGLSMSNKQYYPGVTVGDMIYWAGSQDILAVNVAANTAFTSTYGIMSGTVSSRHVAGVRAIADGCVYWGPYGNTHVLRLDPVSNVLSSQNYSMGSQAVQGIANGKDGFIYMPRHNNANTYRLNPLANTAAVFASGQTFKSRGANMGPDGNVYVLGHPTGRNMWFDLNSNTAFNNPAFLPLASTENYTTLIYAKGKMWATSAETSNFNLQYFTVDGTGVSSDWSANISYTGYMNKTR
jgi:hypothetical protein